MDETRHADDAQLELLLFGTPLAGDPLTRRLLALDPAFTAWLVAHLTREPVVLH